MFLLMNFHISSLQKFLLQRSMFNHNFNFVTIHEKQISMQNRVWNSFFSLSLWAQAGMRTHFTHNIPLLILRSPLSSTHGGFLNTYFIKIYFPALRNCTFKIIYLLVLKKSSLRFSQRFLIFRCHHWRSFSIVKLFFLPFKFYDAMRIIINESSNVFMSFKSL